MKIQIDINHPAHVHYFRNFIKIMEERGHVFKITNRDSPIINKLLDYYDIKHIKRTMRPKKKGTISSLVYLIKTIASVFNTAIHFKPDLFLGFASASCAIVSRFFMKPCILIDDTEHNVINQKLYYPTCSVVLTPFYFNKALGKKQIYFKAFVEQFYLHSKYYNENKEVLKELNLLPHKYVLGRFIAYDAHHDLKTYSISTEDKIDIIQYIENEYPVLLSLEEGAKSFYSKKNILNISPEKIHDLQCNARLMIGEGGTMHTEAFVLGVPTICMNPLDSGAAQYQEKNFSYRTAHSCDKKNILEIAHQFLTNEIDYDVERKVLENDTINPTDFLIWFVENYPESKKIMKENPDYQYIFR